jgi:hypothetical protein
MGFKDIKLFNLAKLGKQGWRLLTKTDSLCEKVLKGKYFPQGDFLTARKKKNSLLTPKFSTRGSLICGPNLVKNPVQRRKVSSKRFG